MKNRLSKNVFVFIAIIVLININIITVKSEYNINNLENAEYYAIIVGCSTYKQKRFNIPTFPFKPISENKMMYLYSVLNNAKNWNNDNIILLLNENATKQNIISAFEEMAAIVDSDDIFLFSWCGHGSTIIDDDGDEKLIDPDDKYDEIICPYDIDKIEGNIVNGISDDELGTLFSNIKAKGMCLIFECCLSGGLVDINPSNNTINKFEKIKHGKLDVDGENRIVIMSTKSKTLGRATFLFGWPLTSSFAFALSIFSKNKDKNGFISAEEAFSRTKPIFKFQNSLLWIGFFLLSFMYIRLFLKNKSIFYSRPIRGTILKLLFDLPIYGKIFNLYLNLFKKIPILSSSIFALINTLFLYCYNQIHSYLITGHFMKNYANIVDDYPDELPIIEI